MKKKIGLFLLLFAVTTEMAFAATYNVLYRLNYQQKGGTWTTSTQNYSETVSGLLINSDEAAKNEVRKKLGAKKGQDTYNSYTGTLYRIEWVYVEKLEKQKEEKAPKEPKQDWVDRNFKPLNLR